ncbi:MAG: GIY-YIG nuclease family protein [Oligoflexia bacterium]|nr:GIY-YIG nuclease family protein [Oligoflexia bacterium]
MSTNWFLYIIETKKGKLYTGITLDIERRFEQHANGTGAKFFRSDSPKKVVYSETFESKGDALRREIEIKKLTRKKKEELFKN